MNRVVAIVCLLIFACSSAKTPRAATLPVAKLAFVDPVTNLRAWTMTEDGELVQMVLPIGTLGVDGTFVFRVPSIAARLDADGRIVITGPERPALDEIFIETMPGLVAGLLAGRGTIRSPYRITADGNASTVDGKSLAIDGTGRIERWEIHGLTPGNRRTAMFIYVLMAMVSEPSR